MQKLGSVLTGKGKQTMPDREKVINALERCDLYEFCVDDSCPYYREVACLEKLRQDALTLLKEQEEEIKMAYVRGYENGSSDEQVWNNINRKQD